MRYPIGIAVIVIALAIFANRGIWLLRLVRSGKPAPGRATNIPARIKAELTEVIGQRKLLKKTVPGIAHAFTFWGFTFLLLTVIEAIGDLFDSKFAIPIIGHSFIIGFLEDFFAVAVLLALCVFTIIRIKNAPSRKERNSRFYGSHTGAAWLVLVGIGLIMITLLVYRAAQVNTGDFPYNGNRWAFASHILSHAFRSLSYQTNYDIESVFVVLNVALIMIFGMVYVPYTKHLHIFVAPLNVLFSRRPKALGPLGSTPKMDVEEMGEDDVFGAGLIEHFSWKQMLDMITCTECGRCQEQCPAWNTGKPLSPKLLIMNLRDQLFKAGPELIGAKASNGGGANGSGQADADVSTNDASGANGANNGADKKELARSLALVPNVIDPDVLWSCTTCGACVEQCPVDIEHIDAIIDMRRYQVLMESEFPVEAGTMLRNIENQGDPWGLGSSQRLEWTKSLDFEIPVIDGEIPVDIEYIFWVGCAGALDERARKVTQSIARLLKRSGVSFGILGPRESCTGDPARRIGNEYLFQMQAQANIETFTTAKVKKIIASCPHCFNSIAREYPSLGGNFEVVHHSQLLEQLLKDGKLRPSVKVEETVTYHDPCYLGRHNEVYDEPRGVLSAIDGVTSIEMSKCRNKAFCCGAGGARMWLEESIGKRVNIERTEHALETGASVVGTACPYCMIMIDDAMKAKVAEEDPKAEGVRVMDVAQILESSL